MVTTKIRDEMTLRRVVRDLEIAWRYEGIGIAVRAKDQSERHAESLARREELLGWITIQPTSRDAHRPDSASSPDPR